MPAVPVSTVPAVKNYLYTQIQARAELTAGIADGSILVSYGPPGPFQPDDIIAVLDADRDVAVQRMVGGGAAGWLDEVYTVVVAVSVHRGDDDPQVVEARAWTLIGIVEDVIRQDPSLGGLVIQANPQTSQQETEWAVQPLEDDGGEVIYTGRLTWIALPIRVHAQL